MTKKNFLFDKADLPLRLTRTVAVVSALYLGVLAVSTAQAAALAYYVSPGGSNTNAGTQQAPFATLEAAQNAIHTARAGQSPLSPATIWIENGTFYRTNSLTLTSADDNLVIEALPTASPRLCGGLPLQPSNFSLVTSNSPVWSRLAPSAQGVVLEANLAAYGITSLPPLIADEYASGNAGATGPFPSAFYCNDQVQQMGRWPNASTNAYSNWVADTGSTAANNFTYSGTEPSRWLNAPDPWYHGLWSTLQNQATLAGESIDTNTQTITLAPWPSDISVAFGAGAPWYAYNLLEEIDTPGEYYIDRANEILYFWPPINFYAADLFVSQLDGPLINAHNGASNIVINGLELSGGRGDLLDTDPTCANIQFSNGRLMGAGRHGAQLNGYSNSITGCEIGFAAGNGVLLEGGDIATLTPGGNAVSNCIIHDWGQITWAVVSAVQTLGTSCGNDIVHNQIYNGGGAGVLFWGNNHRIAFNVISNCNVWNVDYGAVYAADPWVGYGNAIQDNFIYNIYSRWPATTYYTNNPIAVNAIYVDNCKSGTDVSSNVIYMVQQIGIYNNGGRDNIMSNNVIVDCKVMHNGSDLGLGEIKTGPGGGSFNLLQDLQNMNYQSDPWSNAYPLLAAIPDSYSTISNYYAPGNVVFSCNIGWANTNSYKEEEYGSGGEEPFSYYASFTDDLTNSDPLFVDLSNLDLTLQTNSPAYTNMTGFGVIPFLSIGVALPFITNEQAVAAPTGYAAAQAWIDPKLDTNCQAQLFYGPADCGRTTNSWQDATAATNILARGWFSFQVPLNGPFYYGRIYAVNQSGQSWSPTAFVFPTNSAVKSNNTANLNLASSWVGGLQPTAANVAIWNSAVTGPNTVSLGTNLTWGGLCLSNVGGPVTINPGNTLILGAEGMDLTNSFQDLTLNCALTLVAPQVWSTESGYTLTVAGVLTNDGNWLTIEGGGDTLLEGVISGTGGLIMADSGTLTLSASNTYTGWTIVSNGVLLVNGSLPPGNAITVQSNGTLGGAGVLASSITIPDGATLAPGQASSIGTLTINSNLTINGNLVVKLNKALAQSNDTVVVAASLTNSGAGTLSIVNLVPPLVSGDLFTLFNKPLANGNAMTISGPAGITFTNLLATQGAIQVLMVTHIQQPIIQTAVLGEDVTLNTGITNAGPLSYQWQFNGTNLPILITTVAGNGGYGESGDGGWATNAMLYAGGVAVDGLGNFFIADSVNNRVRKVNSNGLISTVAGNGAFDYSGDGGLATNASLANPTSVAADGLGNLWIADEYNECIRKVTSNGLISTVAGSGSSGYSGDGGPATNASLSNPQGVALDAWGNLLIADTDNNRVRKVNSNGVISTVVGQGTSGYSGDGGPATNASLDQPLGLAVDALGDLFIADSLNRRVREVNTNGAISTVAGNGQAGYSGDGGPATNGQLQLPVGIAVDALGDLFIVDATEHVREVAPGGIISTIAGNVGSGFAGDGGAATNSKLNEVDGVAVDAAGLYLADTGNDRIREVTVFGPTLTLTGFSMGEVGLYDLIVSNSSGALTIGVISLLPALPPLTATLGNGSSVLFQFSGTPGSNYVLEGTTNLSPPVLWQPLFTNAAGVNGSGTFTDTNLPGIPARFYRLALP